MDMPSVHKCLFLSHEHEQLKTKIIQLKNHINYLEKKLNRKRFEHNHSCSISCQTDIIVKPPFIDNEEKKSSVQDLTNLHRLVNQQNDLLKKYENQVLEQRLLVQTLPSSSELIDNYQRRLIECQRDKRHAEQRAISAQNRLRKYEDKYENMKKQINVFDDEFFDEVNDLKFAVKQALHLNKEYEKTIQMLSAQLGINYPVE